MRHDSSGLLLSLRWWHWQVAPLHALMVFFFFYLSCLNRNVTLIMLGLDNAGKTATVQGIQGGMVGVWVILHVFHEIMTRFYIFCYCEYFSNACVCVCFCRRSPGCDTHCGIYQDWDEARQIPSDHLWPGWREENPRHLEELLHNVSRRGLCGGLHRCWQDPRDEGNPERGPRSPVHLRQACASVSQSRSLSLIKLNAQNLWSHRDVSV